MTASGDDHQKALRNVSSEQGCSRVLVREVSRRSGLTARARLLVGRQKRLPAVEFAHPSGTYDHVYQWAGRGCLVRCLTSPLTRVNIKSAREVLSPSFLCGRLGWAELTANPSSFCTQRKCEPARKVDGKGEFSPVSTRGSGGGAFSRCPWQGWGRQTPCRGRVCRLPERSGAATFRFV